MKVVRGCIKLGVVRTQAVSLSPEMGKVVVYVDNLESESQEGKPTPCAWRKAAVVESENPVEPPAAILHGTTGV
jgi:hypothetical protein